MQGKESVDLHEREKPAESDPRRDVNDVSRSLDEVREKLDRPSEGEPHKVRNENVPGGEEVPAEDGREVLTG